MYMQGDSERHFAPWRTDPRPPGGLLHDVHAFFGMADAWRALRTEPGPCVPQLRVVLGTGIM